MKTATSSPAATKPPSGCARGRVKSLCLLALVLVICPGCLSTSRVHPQFRTRVQAIHNVAIMPMPATAVRVEVIGAKEVTFPYAEEFCARLRALLVEQCRARGLEVVQPRLTAGDWLTRTNGFEDREVWMQLQLRRAYETIWMTHGGFPRAKTVHPEAALLAEHEQADALLFAGALVVTEAPAAEATRTTMNVLTLAVGLGLAAFGGGSGGLFLEGSPAGCRLEVALVEARTGDILWRSWLFTESHDGLKPDKAVTKIFRSYPIKPTTKSETP